MIESLIKKKKVEEINIGGKPDENEGQKVKL